MSLATWKAEFYPVTSMEAAGDPLTAARHSLTKWLGLRVDALERHRVRVVGFGDLADEEGGADEFTISAASCALCVISGYDDAGGRTACKSCPLYEARNDHRCFESTLAEKRDPYSSWCECGDPELMIAALEKTVAMLEARK